ncbi:hypothetical protein AGMMS49960_12440 [Betaproteobacteria bacterium]|nr:hypothetical protein AGMMS49960_12440 [Betaproteobacteria bacterium]
MVLGFAVVLLIGGAVWGQSEDPADGIGLSVAEVIARFGPPQSVHAVRGLEEWQDDVVFAYSDRELYFYRDRVWQVSVRNAYGIRVGERRGVIPLVLGDGTAEFDTHTLFTFAEGSWPVTVRFNTDRNGLVSTIYIYRSDF